MSKSEMKKKLQNFIDNLMKDYNDKLECFFFFEDDMIREFKSIIEDSDEV